MKKRLYVTSFILWHCNRFGQKVIGSTGAMWGDCTGLRGDCTGLRGDCTGLNGDCSGLWGECTGLSGDCTGLSGDLDKCAIMQEERLVGVSVHELVA